MGEDSDDERRSKKRIALKIGSSSSDTDVDETLGRWRKRRPKPRVMYDDESSDSSDCSVGRRKRGAVPALEDTSDVEYDPLGPSTSSKRVESVYVSELSSEEGLEDDLEKCSICLRGFKGQQTGSPSSCKHVFCLDCILKWSKNMNTCPVDRLPFDSIEVRDGLGNMLQTSSVQSCSMEDALFLDSAEDITVCLICASPEDEATMLLCDGCDHGFHMQCLTPPLQQIPAGRWYCPGCACVSACDEVVLVVGRTRRRTSRGRPARSTPRSRLRRRRRKGPPAPPPLRATAARAAAAAAAAAAVLREEYMDDTVEIEESGSHGPTVGLRPANLLPRRARRKINIDHHAPINILDAILERQSLFHSHDAVLALGADGMSVRVLSRHRPSGAGDAGRKAPMQPGGAPRGGGGGGGGHSGTGTGAAGPGRDVLAYRSRPAIGNSASAAISAAGPPEDPLPVLYGRPPPASLTEADKYDPTEPTNDDSSGDDTPGLSAAVLNDAVQKALREHAGKTKPADVRRIGSDDDSGDCPNFSIYSATSVHIASDPDRYMPSAPERQRRELDHDEREEDLVQEDGDSPPPPPEPPRPPATDYNTKLSRRCPITPNARNPIKIKLNTPTLIKRQVSLYDEEDDLEQEIETYVADPPRSPERPVAEPEGRGDRESDREEKIPEIEERLASSGRQNGLKARESDDERDRDEPRARARERQVGDGSPAHSDRDAADDVVSESYEDISLKEDDDDTPEGGPGGEAGGAEDKATESVSETEDERSYTPCLDENKSKDVSVETEKENVGIEGLDTEMISDDPDDELFSEPERALSDAGSPPPAADRKELADLNRPDGKRKRKKDAKKEAREKKRTKKTDVAFKKPSKSGKERNYREREGKRERRSSERERRRKEKRKDLERYDVRSVVGDKRRSKDAFGRDVSPPAPATPSPPRRPRRDRTPPSPPPARRRQPSPTPTPPRRARRRSGSRGRKKARRSPARKATKKKKRSRSPRAGTPSPRRRRRAGTPPPPSPERKRKRRAPALPSRSRSPTPARSPSAGSASGSRGSPRPRRREPAKEVFASGDNILVSVSFADGPARRRRRRPGPAEVGRPVAIIDLDGSPRELPASPQDVIVVSDGSPPPGTPAPEPRPEPAVYDPGEPTRSPEPPPTLMTLETAQKTNLSADEVIARRPVTPVEKVLALLQSTRASPPPTAPEPDPPRARLFPARSPAAPPPRADSPYSPGSSDFGDLFSPPPPEPQEAPRPRKSRRKKGKVHTVGVKMDEDDLKILDELPNSAVEMQVKNKFLKKLNRQERVVEEVKLVLKPYYNKKRVSKEDYKNILRRAVPKICHNKSGEINPAKIQALVEAYVRSVRKRRKLGLPG